MARKRFIAPEFFKHGALFDAEAQSGLPLRVAFAGMWTQADRRGYFRWRARELKLDVMPYDDVDFSRVLDALAEYGFAERYTVDGVVWGRLACDVLNTDGPPRAAKRRIREGRVSFSRAFRQRLIERDRVCQMCGSPHLLEIDHIVPVVFGGSNGVTNLQCLCAKCNRKKGPRAYAKRRAS